VLCDAHHHSTLGSLCGECKAEAVHQWIKELSLSLPELNCFILPSGGIESAQLHVTRTVCRRFERTCVRFLQECKEQEGSDCEIDEHNKRHVIENYIPFVNRLSDYFFTAARKVCQISGNVETTVKF
jgi:cob(I)alamin adenosyltransferase